MMFQIATAYVLAKDNNDVCAFNFNVTPSGQGNSAMTYRSNIFAKLQDLPNGWRPDSIHKEVQNNSYHIPYNPRLQLRGYFSGEQYINHRRSEVIDLFVRKDIADNLRHGFSGILNNSVAVHVRRGDYLNHKNVYIQLGLDYYKKALDIIREQQAVDNILIFSDDIPWCRQHIKLSNVYFSEGMHDYCDMYLMSLCTHNIMANSSFSWWGSFLNEHPSKIVVAPDKWFITDGVVAGRPDNAEHLHCKNWIRI